MHKDGESALMIPLRVGNHTLLTQSIDDYSPGLFGGRRSFASPELPLATGHATLTIGLPASVHPLVVTGGDHTQWPFNRGDGIALALAALASAVVFRGTKKRALGFASLAGLWFFSHPIFGVTLAATAATAAVIGIAKLPPRTRRWTIGIAVAGAVLGLPLAFNVTRSHDASGTAAVGGMPGYFGAQGQAAASDDGLVEKDAEDRGRAYANDATMAMNGDGKLGNFRAQLAQSGMVDGVRPVALAMPSYTNEVFVQTEMVSAGKPFAPTVYYVTDTGLAVLGLLWLGGAIGLAYSERERMKALREKMKEWLTPKPEATPAPSPAVDAPAPTPAE